MRFFLIFLVSIYSLADIYNLKPVKVAKGVYCFFGKNEIPNRKNLGNISNSCYIDAKDYWIVFDTGPSYDYAKESFEKISKIKMQNVKFVINSHGHDDHFLGNIFFIKKGTVILANKDISEYLNRALRMQRYLPKSILIKSKVKEPDILLKKEAFLNTPIGTIKLICFSAHTKGDVIAYIPKRKVIFAGDIVFNERVPSLKDSDIFNWIKALEYIKSLDANFIIGGHGKIYGKDSYKMTLNYLKDLIKQVKKAIENDIDYEEVTKYIDMSKYKNLAGFKELNNLNILNAYRYLELEIE
ncbi:MBL fold metallo-hydrolase [Nitrosophilus kaiyonis]|uniref:MBL fold metallo-hydrolase n=1 Tax=Nitrosophilus kaiyonis TaxID=2930200 RepID=UPI00248FA949|nr:MBL fold metallo-hydrolase [Nitrosophilus kaiyonis]